MRVDVYARSYISMLYLHMNGMLTTPNDIKNIYEVKKGSYDISSRSYFRMFRCSLKKVCRISRNSKYTVFVLQFLYCFLQDIWGKIKGVLLLGACHPVSTEN
jgi:hypothetical protein